MRTKLSSFQVGDRVELLLFYGFHGEARPLGTVSALAVCIPTLLLAVSLRGNSHRRGFAEATPHNTAVAPWRGIASCAPR